MKKLICLLSILLMLTLLIPAKQANAFRGEGWLLPGLIVGSVIGWSLAPRYYYPPAYYYPPPTYYYPPPPAYYNPPPDEGNQATPSGGQLFIYPHQGQSQEKQMTDRNECHSWAVGQTGYDPSKPPPDNMLGNQITQMSANYLRAMGACLDARGYSMR